MPSSGSSQQSGRYLLTSDVSGFLTDLAQAMTADPTVDVLDALGPAGQPHTLVVAITSDQADALRQRFAGRLRVEADQPLSLYGKRQGRAAAPARAGDDGSPGQSRARPETHASRRTGDTMPQASEPRTAPQDRTQPQGAADAGQPRAAGSQTGAAGAVLDRPSHADTRTPGKVLGGKKSQFVIAPRRFDGVQPMGLMPLAFNAVEQALRDSPDVEVIDTLGPRGLVGTLADGLTSVPNVIVARMADDKAEILRQQGGGQLIVERDQPLTLFNPALMEAGVMAQPGMVMTPATATTTLVTGIVVLGVDNAPIKDAEVFLFGSMLPAMGVTNERGEATLSLFGDTPETIRGIYVKPRADYWDFYQAQPAIDVNGPNVVLLSPLSDTFREFPRKQMFGWGQKAMRLDQVPSTLRGQGVKVAVVDSGAATTHTDLHGIRFGLDIINKRTTPATWNQDTVAHGSHCAGVIAGAENGMGIVGFAPSAEVHVCKIFPGGQVSQLIDALEYCIEQQIDIVNLSLGSNEPSEALEQQIVRARRLGVACIVAAGNSGGPVQYPASSPNVLAVAAIGKIGEFPPSSHHTQSVSGVSSDGYFSPKFTCFGPEIGVCAPGVAILSTVPPNNYAAWDGTSMAAPHVSGVAALVLAHHPDFQGPFKTRSAARVDRLFQILRASAQPVHLGDPRRTGFGMPDALVALGLQQSRAAQVPVQPFAPQAFVPQAFLPPGFTLPRPGHFPPMMVPATAASGPFAPQGLFSTQSHGGLPLGSWPFDNRMMWPRPFGFAPFATDTVSEAYRRWGTHPYASLAALVGSQF